MDARFEQARQRFLEGVAHCEAGRPAQAEACFEAALELVPGRPSVVVNLAAVRNRLGRHAQALALLDGLPGGEADDADAWLQRGAALAGLQRHGEALGCFERATELQPAQRAAHFERGMSLNALHRHAEALAAFEQLLALDPEGAEAWLRHGQTLHRLGRLDAALASCDRAVALAPDGAAAWTQRGSLLREAGRRDEAAAAFRESIARGGDAALNAYYLASLGGGPAPGTAPAAYVQALFDDYADDFEDHLVHGLRYRAHQALAEGLRALAPARRFDSALDLGCGSGLCGALLRESVARLEGVDLSPRMVTRAQARGVYDRVQQAELVAYLQASERRHDLVVAADVLIYVGALEPVFAGVRRVLRPGGLFGFSVERAADEEALQLRASLRYAHSRPYVERAAAQAGFELLRLHGGVVREDQGRPIEGLYAWLRAA